MRRTTIIATATLIALTALGGVATAQSEPWTIKSYDVIIDVKPDGTMLITEEIGVEFRAERHGIVREIPVHYELAYDTPIELPDPELTPADYVRVYEIGAIDVSSPTAPDEVLVTRPDTQDAWLNIRIGEEDTLITGRHEYVISYRVRGGLNDLGTHTELFWDAIGALWDVPIEAASTTVSGPGMRRATCFQGPANSDRLCDQIETGADRARFKAGSLPPRSGMTVAVGFDPASVDAGTPILRERFDLGRRLLGSDAAIPLAVLLGVVGLAGVGVLLFREGRDRETIGDVSIDGTVRPREVRRRPLLARLTVPVQFRPPDGLRPAQLGLIVDEVVDPVDITATIVDLAVRGHLRIIEEENKRLFWLNSTEHVLERLPDPPPDDQLLRYEQKLLDALFTTGDRVALNDLHGTFHTQYTKVSELIYEDGRSRRWFHRAPHKTRTMWRMVAFGGLVLSGIATALLIRYTRMGILGAPLALSALALLALNRWMPHRTARGSDLLVKTLGFKEFIVTAESGRMDFAEQEHLFLEYLPYAVVFGATDKWAKAFADLGVDISAHGFYVSHTGVRSLDGLSRGLNSFSSTAGSGLAKSPSGSGGSGFGGVGGVGGGGGGGGGGSW